MFKTIFTGKNFIELDYVDSTNNYAANLLNTTKVPDGTVIMAHYQDSGRGQMGNTWSANPSENLTMSAIYHVNFITANEIFLISMATALSVKETIEHFTKQETFIKWPNDIFVNEKKISGMLIENQWRGNKLSSIIGIGLNINQTSFSSDINATSLKLLENKDTLPFDALQMLCQKLEYYMLKLKYGHKEFVHNEYLKALLFFKQSRTFRTSNSTFQGKITNVLRSGQLEVTNIDGSQQLFSFKEVSFI